MNFGFAYEPFILDIHVSTETPIYDIGRISRFAHGIGSKKFVEEGISILEKDVFSVSENITIDIEVFISERLARQINRHRHMAIVQKSTRYNDYVNQHIIDFYVPEGLSKQNEELYKRNITSLLIWNEKMEKATSEQINYLLPLCTMTKVHYHMNLRTLLHMYHVRFCSQALDEYQKLLSELKEKLKDISSEWYYIMELYATPKCAQQHTFHCFHPELNCEKRKYWEHFTANKIQSILEKTKGELESHLNALLLKYSILK